MIHFHIRGGGGGGGGLWWKFEIKTQDRTLSINNNPGLVGFFLKLTRIQGGHNVFITKELYESRYQILCEKFKNKIFGLMCQNYNFIFSKHFKVIADK